MNVLNLPQETAIKLRARQLSTRTIGDAMRAPRGNESKIIDGINRRMMRMYESAVTSNLSADFPVSVTSANAENLVSILATRSRMRRLERDDPYARGAIKTTIVDVCGDDPFRLEMKVGKKDKDGQFIPEEDTNEEIEQAWKEAGEKLNCCANQSYTRDEMYWQACAAMVRDGGILYRHHRLYPLNDFGYAIEPIEFDRLEHWYAQDATGAQNQIRMSIEMGRQWKNPVAYWILERHPGDMFAWTNGKKFRERVAAEDVITLFEIRTRAEQLTGMPRGASSVNRLHRIDQWDIAYGTAAIWSACKPFFFTQPIPTALEFIPDFIRSSMEQVAGAIDSQGGYPGFGPPGGGEGKYMALEPGTPSLLPYGFDVKQLDAKYPHEAGEGFKRDNLRGASCAWDVPYHRMSQDASGLNFSSIRAIENAWHANCKIDQKHIIGNLCHQHFRAWLPLAILSGKIKQPASRLKEFEQAAEFFGRRWGAVNPLQDSQADILDMEAGVKAPSDVVAESERGGTYIETCARIAADRATQKKHGLDFSGDPSLPTIKKGAPGQAQPDPNDLPLPAKTGGKQTIKCAECGTARHNGEMICRECGGDGIQIGELSYARR